MSEAQGVKPKAAERVFASARDLFYRIGIRAVGVEEVVKTAGVTKPSLYRAFKSKDDLTARYLHELDLQFWQHFDEAVAAYPADPSKQILAFMLGIAERCSLQGYRGCGLTNAAVEFPEAGHPARRIPEFSKRKLRARLRVMATEMGAPEPDVLADGLLLLIEGAFVSVHVFGASGPARNAALNADLLLKAHLNH